MADVKVQVELGFVITFHKIQGKTVKNNILDLNPRPFPRITFNMLLVAVSRVPHGSGLRILRLRENQRLWTVSFPYQEQTMTEGFARWLERETERVQKLLL